MMTTTHPRAAWLARVERFARIAALIGLRAEAEDADTLRAQLGELHGRQAGLVARNQQVLDLADHEGRKLTDDERRAIARRTAEVEALDEQAAALQARLDASSIADDYRGGPTAQPRRAGAAAGDPVGGVEAVNAPGHRVVAIGGAAPRNFAAMFPRAEADPYRGAFESLGAFALAVASGSDGRLRAATMTTGVGVDGGFLIPPQFLTAVMDQALSMEVVRPRANVVPMLADQATAALFDHQDGTGGRRAGLQLLWGPEATALTEQKAKARELNLRCTKGNIFCRVSSELASDAVDFDRSLSAAMVEAVAAGLDYAGFWGTGAAQPLGIMNSGALITVPKVGSQAADSLLLDNLAQMVARLTPASFSRSFWHVHPTLVPQLYMMSYVVKNVAGSENVGGAHVQAVTVGADGQLMIFGRPCLVTDVCAPVGDLGDIVLADWSRYLIGMRQTATIKRDDSRYFDTDEVAFKLTLRLSGQPTESTTTKLRDGTNTVSPFVTLEAR